MMTDLEVLKEYCLRRYPCDECIILDVCKSIPEDWDLHKLNHIIPILREELNDAES